MDASYDTATLSRERRAELLSVADPARLLAIANDCLTGGAELRVIRYPEIGSVVAQIREPIARQRFILGDVLVCQAEVSLDGNRGWAMRLGSDEPATLAAAICDAEIEARGPNSHRVESLCESTAEERIAAEAAEWSRLEPTIVEFEDIP